MLYNQQYSLSPVAAPLFNSFECLVLTISESFSTAIVIVCRPPKANKDFLSEFAELLSFLCLKFERTLIQGDFNIHMDKKDSTLTKDFLSLLECFDLNQFVDCFTHNKGHILDLVISSGSLVSQLSTVDLGLSDHLAIFFDLYLPGAYISSSRIVTYRKWRSIELSDFSVFIDSSLSSFSSFDPLETKVSMLNSVLLSGLDTFAPQKSRSVSFVRPAPWYNDDLRMMKTSCRKMERNWRLSGLTVNYEAWKDCLQEYKVRIVSARSDYFSKMIDDNQRNPRQLFNSINKLLKCNSSLHVTASTHLVISFLTFLLLRLIMYARVFVLLFHCRPLLLMFLILVLFFQIFGHLIHTLFKRRFLK